jgi:hypothetical protein
MAGAMKRGVWIWALALFAGVLAIFVTLLTRQILRPFSLRGAVVKDDPDPRKQSPITDAEVTVEGGFPARSTKSDFSGYFKLVLPRGIGTGRTITLRFRHPDYEPLDLKETVANKLYVVYMKPMHPASVAQPNHPEIAVSNVFVRYTIESTTMVNIGTGIQTFQVQNRGDVPCNGRAPCSPDGKWKASIGSTSLDAGEGNVYDDARLSCIAGPCPFTKVIFDGFSHGGRKITVSVLDWSDTTTFLLEAEAFRNEISDMVRESYPFVFGQAINFSLPASAEGPSLEAEIDGTDIVFPLGPSPQLSWADCNVRVGRDQSKSYRCELKSGYRFR